MLGCGYWTFKSGVLAGGELFGSFTITKEQLHILNSPILRLNCTPRNNSTKMTATISYGAGAATGPSSGPGAYLMKA